MKKALSVLLAGAMVAGMSVSAFAADDSIEPGKVYDSDGVSNDDVKAGGFTNWTYTNHAANFDNFTIDGVVPGAELYIPLAQENNAKFENKTTITADNVATKLGGDATTVAVPLTDGHFYLNAGGTDADEFNTGDDLANFYKNDSSNKYYETTSAAVKEARDALTANDYEVELKNLVDDDYFKFDVDKDDGSKYIKKIEVVDDKKLGDLKRSAFLKITLNDSTTTDDLKSTGTITFEAKDDSDSEKDVKQADNMWNDGLKFDCDYTLWINNIEKSGSDEDAETGDRVYFDPEDNEDNTFVWGDDRAAMFFEGNDDAGSFYARLQTKADSSIYAEYGDPVNADLWFYDFVGNPTIPSTSRATVTLGIPWDEDDDYTPRPEDCFIYEVDADGYLNDVTDLFTFDEDNDGTTEIEGWTIKTRTLGTYVISDTELDVEVYEEVEEEEAPEVEEEVAAPADDVKAIPNTGSSDMVGAAVVAAVVSLAAAGAVAFKKASK